jgi:hypothetical protein
MNVPRSNKLKGAHIVRSASWNALREAAMRLPEGAAGQMIYHDGFEWVLLDPPLGGGVHVLSHNCIRPSWLATWRCAT